MEKFRTTWEGKERSQAEMEAIEKMQEVADALVTALREQNAFPQTTITSKDASGMEVNKVVDCTVLIDVSENTNTGRVYTGLVFQAGRDQLRANYDLENQEVTNFQYKADAFTKGSKWDWVNNIDNPKAELVEMTRIIPSKNAEKFAEKGNGKMSPAFSVYLQMSKDFRAREDVPMIKNKDGKDVQAYGISNLEDASFTGKGGNKIEQQSFDLYQKVKPDSNVKESVQFTLAKDGSLKSVRLMQYDYNSPENGKNFSFTSETVKDGNYNKFNKLIDDSNLKSYTQDLLNSYKEARGKVSDSIEQPQADGFEEVEEEELPFE